MEQEGIVAAEGCPHFITARRVEAWRSRYGNTKTKCKGCTAEGFIPTQRLRATRRRKYEAEQPGLQVDRHLA